MRNLVLLLVSAALLSACAGAGKLRRIEVGMSRAQVVNIMGEPSSVSFSAQAHTVYMNYALSATSAQAIDGVTKPYYVRLVEGRVDAVGRSVDFDNSQDANEGPKTQQAE